MFYGVSITKHHAGFGMWQGGEANGEGWEDEQDLAQDIYDTWHPVYQLGRDDLPDDIEDIRGSVYNEPDTIYATYTEDASGRYPMYMGIVEREEVQE